MNTASALKFKAPWILLALAVVFWGVNWPIMKIGLAYIGPLWFATLRVLVASLCLFVLLMIQGRLTWPKQDEQPVLLSVGIFQIAVFMGLIHYSLLSVEAGRSAILTYTTPLWTVPLAWWFLNEKLTRRKLISIIFSLAGVVVLFHPLSFPWGWNAYAVGNGILLFAALVWAGTIVHLRGFGWVRPHISLLPWQFLLGGAVLSVVAYIIEGPLHLPTSVEFAMILAFNAVFATAFSFWAFIQATRVLSANGVAVSSLGVPVVGIASSLLILGEPISLETAVGGALILSGIWLFNTGHKA